MSTAAVETGGDYPRDLATRELVAFALTAASLLQGGDLAATGPAGRGLMTAARQWHKAHAPSGARETDAGGSGGSGR